MIYISIAPNPARWHLKNAWLDLNARIKAYTKTDARLTFVDIWGEMLGASGQPRPELFVEDQLHMNERGYAIWARVLRPVVEREFKAAGTEVPAPHVMRRLTDRLDVHATVRLRREPPPVTPTTSTDASAAGPGGRRSGSRR